MGTLYATWGGYLFGLWKLHSSGFTSKRVAKPRFQIFPAMRGADRNVLRRIQEQD
jgi:hypothetical protein